MSTTFPQARPFDSHNRELVENVHPAQWHAPKPARRYNLVVVGAGTAGLVTAAGAAGLGARVALVERELMGGDCLNVGCVPSKALIRSARAAAEVRRARELGIQVEGPVRVDFGKVMERMRALRAGLSAHDSAARFRALGVDVFLGAARFVGPDCVEVDGAQLRFERACIATGARAAAPSIPGLQAAGYLTNESVFSLTDLPARMVVLGSGPIGCELAQVFARLGSRVTLIERSPRILAREDPDAARIVEHALQQDGVTIEPNARLESVESKLGAKLALLDGPRGRRALEFDALLVGVGRVPNVDGLGLESAGVEFDRERGVVVDDFLRTTSPRIYAAGDVASAYKFTHMADALARIVIQNALFFGRARASALVVPWCTYTDPEVAHVGLYAHAGEARGIAIDTFQVELSKVDRAVLDGQSEGFLKVHVAKGRDRILGATLVSAHAGETISEIALAMTAKLGLTRVAKTIHPYPTQAEAFKRAADMFQRSRLTPRLARAMTSFLRWRRGGE